MRAEEVLAELRRAGDLVEQQVAVQGTYGGWSGHDVLVHLGAYTRVVGAILRGVAERRQPGAAELYGRELTPAELAITDLHHINRAVIDEHAHLSFAEAHEVWRSLVDDALAQAVRLPEEQWALPGPDIPPGWWRPHLWEVVTKLAAHYDAHLSGRPH